MVTVETVRGMVLLTSRGSFRNEPPIVYWVQISTFHVPASSAGIVPHDFDSVSIKDEYVAGDNSLMS
jgi:hypothetical protein